MSNELKYKVLKGLKIAQAVGITAGVCLLVWPALAMFCAVAAVLSFCNPVALLKELLDDVDMTPSEVFSWVPQVTKEW